MSVGATHIPTQATPSMVSVVIDVDPQDPWDLCAFQAHEPFLTDEGGETEGAPSVGNVARILSRVPVAVYEQAWSPLPLNIGWLNRYLACRRDGCYVAGVNLVQDILVPEEIEIARWYFRNLYGFRLGVCDREESLAHILSSIANQPSLSCLIAAFCMRHKGNLRPRHIKRMLDGAYGHRSIVRAMDAYGVPR